MNNIIKAVHTAGRLILQKPVKFISREKMKLFYDRVTTIDGIGWHSNFQDIAECEYTFNNEIDSYYSTPSFYRRDLDMHVPYYFIEGYEELFHRIKPLIDDTKNILENLKMIQDKFSDKKNYILLKRYRIAGIKVKLEYVPSTNPVKSMAGIGDWYKATITHISTDTTAEYRDNAKDVTLNKAFEMMRSEVKKKRDNARKDIPKKGIQPPRILQLIHPEHVRRNMMESKRMPDNDKRHIGLEVEFFVEVKPKVKEEFAIAVKRTQEDVHYAFRAISNKVKIGRDASISSIEVPHALTFEVKMLTDIENYVKDITLLGNALTSIKAMVNKTCGFHVHLDARHTKDEANDMYKRLTRALPWLARMVRRERRANKYCRINLSTKPKKNGNRYQAINYEAFMKYRTIEVRLHTGTTKKEKMIRWVSILLSIAYGNSKLKPVKDIKEFQKVYNINDIDLEYMKNRIAKHNNKPSVLKRIAA